MQLTMLLEMAAEAFPERIAVVADDTALSYAQLLNAARHAAAEFRTSGCRHVALLDTNSPATPVAIFGAAFAGKPYVPLNYRLTAAELNALLERIEPAYLIGDRAYWQALTIAGDSRAVETADFFQRVTTASSAADVDATETEIAIQLFTSGTTGQPKAAILRHDNLLAYILGTVEFGAAAEHDAILVSVPPYHIAGISAVLSSTYACRRMVQLPNFEAAHWLRLCREHRVSNAFLVPTMLSRVVDHLEQNPGAEPLPDLRAIAYGGGKMPLSVIEKAMRWFPRADFTNAYGLTETSSTIVLLTPDDHRAAAASDDVLVRKRLGSVGRPIDGIELQVRDEQGAVLGAFQAGDIYVRGPQVAGEYLGSGSQLDQQGWFATRDRGYLDADGYLFLEGRADDVIVRGGENISPGEIEDILLDHPAVADAAVVAMPSEQWGETVAAAVVLKPGAAVSAPQLQALVKSRLRSSRVPEAIQFKDSLPYNETGKLLRRVIRQAFQ